MKISDVLRVEVAHSDAGNFNLEVQEGESFSVISGGLRAETSNATGTGEPITKYNMIPSSISGSVMERTDQNTLIKLKNIVKSGRNATFTVVYLTGDRISIEGVPEGDLELDRSTGFIALEVKGREIKLV